MACSIPFGAHNKLSQNFDHRPHVILDCFYGQLIGTLVDNMRGNPAVIPLNSAPSRGGFGPYLIREIRVIWTT